MGTKKYGNLNVLTKQSQKIKMFLEKIVTLHNVQVELTLLLFVILFYTFSQ